MPKTRHGLLDEETIQSANSELAAAFGLTGHVRAGALVCPTCGTSKPKKVVFRKSNGRAYWKCFKCGSYGSAVKLVEEFTDLTFRQAALTLIGEIEAPANSPTVAVSDIATETFQASVDDWVWDVYKAVLTSEHASTQKAQAYFAQWHIAPQAVAEQGAVYIVEPGRLKADLVAQFGAEALHASGLAITSDRDPDGVRLLCGWNYPVVEPAINPFGIVRNLQFRPSPKQMGKIAEHRAGNGPYVPAFMSIRGSGQHHLIGCGTQRLSQIEPATVHIVEGFKDLLAARSMGLEAYAMPGTAILPPKAAVQWLARKGHRIDVCLDGDEAGRKAQPIVREHFIANGFTEDAVTVRAMPDGRDITDLLVEAHHKRGCSCVIPR